MNWNQEIGTSAHENPPEKKNKTIIKDIIKTNLTKVEKVELKAERIPSVPSKIQWKGNHI